MAEPFLGPDFLLPNESARRLYREYAADQPIFDYHCHLPVQEIAANRDFPTITEIWLGGDHYKWRAMRALGIDERLITGDAGDYEKFAAWAEAVPFTVRNPLYHWTHMELRRPFEVDELLSPRDGRGDLPRLQRAAAAAGAAHPRTAAHDERARGLHHGRPGRQPGAPRAHPHGGCAVHGGAGLSRRPCPGRRRPGAAERLAGRPWRARGQGDH